MDLVRTFASLLVERQVRRCNDIAKYWEMARNGQDRLFFKGFRWRDWQVAHVSLSDEWTNSSRQLILEGPFSLIGRRS